MKTTRILFTTLMAASLIFMGSCAEDEGPAVITIVSISAEGTDLATGNSVTIDLNGATAATDVPIDATIVITFSRDISATTASASSVELSSSGGTAATNVSASGAAVTITVTEDLMRGSDYSLSLSGSIEAADGGTFTAATRTFSTGGRTDVDPPNASSQVAFFNFDGDALDKEGDNDPTAVVDVTFDSDRHGQTESAVYFDGETSIIEIPGGSTLMNSTNFTISFWVKTNTTDHVNANGDPTGMFVLGLGTFLGIQYEIFGSFDGSKFAIGYENDQGATYSEDMWFPNGATDNTNGGWQGWTFAKSLTAEEMSAVIKDNWYHVIYTYNGAERTGDLYFNGELMKSFDFDLWPDDSDKYTTTGLKYRGVEPDVLDELALGFIHSRGGTMWDSEPWGGYDFTTANHFKGWMDDLRIFHAAFSAEDAEALYNAEKN